MKLCFPYYGYAAKTENVIKQSDVIMWFRGWKIRF